ncbi:hypothetical protein F4777DRAFT_577245 [Nemania sp. FL0916]|nr:hypothetical protein F4777DRAFT_577245 [Nemania sp. FL0916]
MAPPPATPTPHRFLASSKRAQPRSSNNETPRPGLPANQQQQFRATPRFSLPSTPRPGPSSSSFTPFRHRGAAAGRDVLIDSSPPPPSSEPGAEDCDDDRISVDEDEDGVIHESSPIWGVESDGDDGETTSGERRAKRRRISSSPPGLRIDEPSSLGEADDGEFDSDVEMRSNPAMDIESSFSGASVSENDGDVDLERDDAVEYDIDIDIDITGETAQNPHPQEAQTEMQPPKSHQPAFQKAPRFKPAEAHNHPQHAAEPLPDVFSPRRRGDKYVPGGLASELRDWLVDVEAGIGSTSSANFGGATRSNAEWVAKIRVDELMGADGKVRGMALVQGRQVLEQKRTITTAGTTGDDDRRSNEDQEVVETLGTHTVRIILAGPGRLTGLGVAGEVRPGVLLGIARPTWDVVLDGLGRWGVACDWVVLS